MLSGSLVHVVKILVSSPPPARDVRNGHQQTARMLEYCRVLAENVTFGGMEVMLLHQWQLV